MRIVSAALVAASLVCAPMAFAAGGDSPTPPKPTNTTKTCKGVKVWDDAKKRCIRPKQSSLDQDQMIQAVRELAYAGRHQDAQGVLQELNTPDHDMALTYWGFTHRKMGNQDLAERYYQQAIARNPDNLLARSYYGQGLVSAGRIEEAIAQWKEIRARGGQGSWAETTLSAALESGLTFDY